VNSVFDIPWTNPKAVTGQGDCSMPGLFDGEPFEKCFRFAESKTHRHYKMCLATCLALGQPLCSLSSMTKSFENQQGCTNLPLQSLGSESDWQRLSAGSDASLFGAAVNFKLMGGLRYGREFEERQ